jgi:hypothetical protein
MGSFQSGQVLANLKYGQLKSAADWWTFAASGPGSRRGLNRVLGVPQKLNGMRPNGLIKIPLQNREASWEHDHHYWKHCFGSIIRSRARARPTMS